MASDARTGLLADAYLQKGGDHSPEVLVQKIRELLEKSPLRANIVRTQQAPVWIPLDGKSYFVLTCPECLRSFSLPAPHAGDVSEGERTARCEFCEGSIGYVLDGKVVRHVKVAE